MPEYSVEDVKNIELVLKKFDFILDKKRIKQINSFNISEKKEENLIHFFEREGLRVRKIKDEIPYKGEVYLILDGFKTVYLEKKGKDFLFYNQITNRLEKIEDLKFDENFIVLDFEKIKIKKKESPISSLINYIKPYKKEFRQLIYGVVVITFLQLLSPFLMQLLIDKGLVVENINTIKLILYSFIMIKVSSFFAEFFRSWLYLHIGTKISIDLISDFLFNVIQLPINFFNSKTTGDLLQRIEDNKRIESFLTKQIVSFVFNVTTLITYSIVLLVFDLKVFGVFLIGSLIYFLWIFALWNLRKKIDISIFQLRTKNQNILVQLLQSIQEIKLSNIENEKRWEWEDNQGYLYFQNKKNLIIGQLQSGVGLLINEVKNSFIIYFAAISTINGEISFGAMMAVQYVLGQTNVPLKGIISFSMSYQMAFLSFQRIKDIVSGVPKRNTLDMLTKLPQNKSIIFRNVSYAYPNKGFRLYGLDFEFKQNEVTAIIGASGGGKTTVLKLILKFFNPYKGEVLIGDINVKTINTEKLRRNCGTILQDSIIFNDTIVNNICLGDDLIDFEKIIEACKKAKIYNYIENLPDGLNTVLNYKGKGLSQGQIQRILLARVFYRNPPVILLDEATNALDIKTENSILVEFESFFKSKTVVVIAHSLNTIKLADKIVVIDKGTVVEQGSHEDLILNSKFYSKMNGVKLKEST